MAQAGTVPVITAIGTTIMFTVLIRIHHRDTVTAQVLPEVLPHAVQLPHRVHDAAAVPQA